MAVLLRYIAGIGLIIAFLLPSLGYGWKQLTGLGEISESERRILTPFPEFSGDLRAFTSDIDDHLEDSFGFRMIMIRTARKIRDNLGENPADVAYGQEGWLFLNEAIYRDEFEGSGPWTAKSVENWIDGLETAKSVFDNHDIPFAAIIAPDKSRIYSEYTPPNWTESARRFVTALMTETSNRPTGLIDIEPLILTEKEAGRRVYYMRDTHWTPDGSFPVYETIMGALDPDQSQPRYNPPEPRLYSPNRTLDLDGLLGLSDAREPDFMSIGAPPLRGYSVERREATLTEGGGFDEFATIVITDQETQSDKTLVVVGDSFADVMMPQLKRSYGRIIRIYHGADRYRVSLDTVLSYNPDAVLFMAVERNAIRMDHPFVPQP